MPAGPQLIEAVAQCLAVNAGEAKMALHPSEIQVLLDSSPTKRAIRYALTALVKDGRAKRRGPAGPAYAVEGVTNG